MAGSVAPGGELRMAGSMRSSDGSGVGKNSLGEIDATVMLYAMSSLSVQSLPDLADRIRSAITTLISEYSLEYIVAYAKVLT